MTEYKCGSAKQCQFGDMCKPKYDIGGCSHYKNKKPQTNEEWLHSLNTEQLAEWIKGHMNCNFCPMRLKCEDMRDCMEHIKAWLKQPHTDFVTLRGGNAQKMENAGKSNK